MSDGLGSKGQQGLAVITEMMGPDFGKALEAHATSGTFGSVITRMALEHSFADAWGRPGLARRDRSLVTLGILIALRQPSELKNHVKIGIANGLSVAEIEETLIHASSYVGFPITATASTAEIEALRDIGRVSGVKTAEESVTPFGVGAEIAARPNEELFGQLLAPVERVGSNFSPVPFSKSLESGFVPTQARIEMAVRKH